MSVDTELELWRRQWQSDTTVPPDLRRKVERQSIWMKMALLADILVTVTIGGAMAAWAVRAPQPNIILLAAWTWIVIVAAWAFALRVNRGNWSPSSEAVAAFVELSVRRCRARLLAVRFAAGLFVVQVAFLLGWVYNNSPARGTSLWLFLSSVPIDVVWACTLAFFVFLIWYRRKKHAELVYFLSLRQETPVP